MKHAVISNKLRIYKLNKIYQSSSHVKAEVTYQPSLTSQHYPSALTYLKQYTPILATKCQNDQSQSNFIKVAQPCQLI